MIWSETWFKNMAKTRCYEHKICMFIELSPARKTVIIIIGGTSFQRRKIGEARFINVIFVEGR